jgi:hypothetical protein
MVQLYSEFQMYVLGPLQYPNLTGKHCGRSHCQGYAIALLEGISAPGIELGSGSKSQNELIWGITQSTKSSSRGTQTTVVKKSQGPYQNTRRKDKDVGLWNRSTV